MRKKFTSPLWMWLLLAAAGLAGSGEVAAQAHGIRIANAIDDHHSATELVAATAIPSEGLTQKNSERSVTVQVTPLNVSSGSGTLDFRIVLDTHLVALDYDLVRITTLVDDKGNEYRPVSWTGGSGGHHVEGTLKFADRDSILSLEVSYLEMRMADVAGVPNRLFRWSIRP